MKRLSAVGSRLSAPGVPAKRTTVQREVSGGAAARSAARSFTLIELLVVIGIILLLTGLIVGVIVGIQSRTEVRDTENTMRLMDQAMSEWELAMGRQVAYGRSANFDGITNTEPNCPNVPAAQQPRYELPQLVTGGFTWTGETAEGDAAADSLRTTDMLWAILRRSASSQEVIARVNPDFLIELDPDDPEAEPPQHFGVNDLDHLITHMNRRISFRFLDAWDNPIIAVLPGRPFANRCPDGSVHNESGLNYVNQADDDGTIRTPFENRFGVAVNRRIYFVSAGPSGRFGDLSEDPDTDEYRDALDNIYSYEVIRP